MQELIRRYEAQILELQQQLRSLQEETTAEVPAPGYTFAESMKAKAFTSGMVNKACNHIIKRNNLFVLDVKEADEESRESKRQQDEAAKAPHVQLELDFRENIFLLVRQRP